MSAGDSAEVRLGVTVVVPFHNNRDYVGACVDALLAQESPERGFEVVMVDNNSKDGSADIIRERSGVRLVSERRPGPYAARNRGIQEAHGDIVAFTDADCRPEPGWLKAIGAAMDDPEVGIVQGPQAFGGRSTVLRLLARYESEKNRFIFSEGSTDVLYACANSLAVRRHLFQTLGMFEERIRGADVIFVQRAVRQYSRAILRYSPGARVVHLEVDSARSWLGKLFIYGRSYEAYRSQVECRPLSTRERLTIAKRLFARRPAAVPTLFIIAPILALGALSYEAGRWSGRWRGRPRSSA